MPVPQSAVPVAPGQVANHLPGQGQVLHPAGSVELVQQTIRNGAKPDLTPVVPGQGQVLHPAGSVELVQQTIRNGAKPDLTPVVPQWSQTPNRLQAHFSLEIRDPFRLICHWTRLTLATQPLPRYA